MDIKILREKRSEIIYKFKNNITIDELCKQYNAKYSQIYDVIAPSLRHTISDVTEFEKKRIKKLYESGLSCTKIAIEMNLYHKQVNQILDSYGIKRDRKVVENIN